MSFIFLSHSSRDDSIADAMRRWLAREGHEAVFLDHDDQAGIAGGEAWNERLYTELRRCRALVALISSDWLASPWCVAEADHAQALRKPVLPLRISPIEPAEYERRAPPVLRRVEGIAWDGRKKARERLRRALLAAGLDPKNLFTWHGDRAPYPGLASFERDDAAIYFGREQEITNLLALLRECRAPGRPRLVLLQGASGTGKSPLLRAGVLPRLERDPDSWLVLPPFRPDRDPLANLAKVLAAAPGDKPFDPPPSSLGPEPVGQAAHAKWLAAWGKWIAGTAAELRGRAGRPGATVLLSVDQLEEALAGPGDSGAAGNAFLLALREALAVPDHQLLAVATLRADFIGTLQRHPALREPAPERAEILSTAAFQLGPLRRAAFHTIIEAPAALAELELEPGLASRLVDEARTDDALPLLAFVLRELWDRHGKQKLKLTQTEYAAFGGLEAAVGSRAEQIIAAIRPSPSEAELDVFRTILVYRMVELSAYGQIVRRRLPWTEVPEPARRLVEEFARAHLLIADAVAVEVVHDALFRTWKQLKEWLKDAEEGLGIRRRAREAAKAWEEAGWPPGSLWRPPELDLLLRYAERSSGSLSALEEAFLDASVREHEARRKRALEAQVRHLAAQGQVILAFDPPEVGERGLLLAMEAIQRARELPRARLGADQALRQGLALLGRRLQAVNMGGEIHPHAWAPHPRAPIVAFGSADAGIYIWNLQSGAVDHPGGLPVSVDVLDFSTDGQWMAAGGSGHVLLCSLKDKTMRSFPAVLPSEPASSFGPASALAFSRGTDRLAVAFGHRTLLWSLAEPEKPPLALPPAIAPVVSLGFSADGLVLLEQAFGAPAVCWRWRDGARIGVIGHGGNQVLHSPDGRFVGATGPGSYVATLWDTYLQEGHQLANNGAKLAFSADSSFVAMASPEHFAEMWRLPDRSPAHSWRHYAEVWDLDFSPDSTKLITQSKNNVAHVWATGDGAELARLIHNETLRRVRYTGDSRKAVTLSGAGILTLWDTVELRQTRTLGFRLPTLRVAFSREGNLLAVGVREGPGMITPVLIDLPTEQFVAEIQPSHAAGAVTGAEYARTLLGAHDAATKAETRSASGCWQTMQPSDNVITVINSGPDREAEGVAEPHCTLHHDHPVRRAIFSPDENYLATVSDRDHVRIWDLCYGVEVSRLTLPAPTIADAAFSVDGRLIATAGSDGKVRLWLWRAEDLAAEARSRVTRELEKGERDRHMPDESDSAVTPAAPLS